MCIYNVAVVLGYFQLRYLSYESEWSNNSYFHSFSEFVTILWLVTLVIAFLVRVRCRMVMGGRSMSYTNECNVACMSRQMKL